MEFERKVPSLESWFASPVTDLMAAKRRTDEIADAFLEVPPPPSPPRSRRAVDPNPKLGALHAHRSIVRGASSDGPRLPKNPTWQELISFMMSALQQTLEKHLALRAEVAEIEATARQPGPRGPAGRDGLPGTTLRVGAPRRGKLNAGMLSRLEFRTIEVDGEKIDVLTSPRN